MFDQRLPAPLTAALNALFATEHEGHDFEPFDEFDSAEETTRWWRAWTGDEEAGEPPLRFFGKDGSGGRATIWLCDPNAPLEAQPVVFLGSEGELAVLAQNLGDYLWLLANGVGPLEPVGGLIRKPQPIPELVALAPGEPRSSAAVLAAGETLQEGLEEFVEEACNGPFDHEDEPI
ncbi:MAG TPA: SMI1/KNR4 family protein [Actinoplanes sp.]|nr:SMI1/KNR4 family protein [Actinoplanes sp.]